MVGWNVGVYRVGSLLPSYGEVSAMKLGCYSTLVCERIEKTAGFINMMYNPQQQINVSYYLGDPFVHLEDIFLIVFTSVARSDVKTTFFVTKA